MRLLERRPRETGRDYALRTIRENIISLDLAPGSQISENELAAEMGLSRTPVREALIELAKVKIITIEPQKKSVVSFVDFDMVEESRFMRNVLECAVVELVCEMARPEDIRRLEENVKLQEFSLTQSYPESLMKLDNEFHRMLFAIARKDRTRALMDTIAIHFDRVRTMALSSVKDQKIVQDHHRILEAICSRDPEGARKAMQVHIHRYKFDAEVIRAKYPQYFA